MAHFPLTHTVFAPAKINLGLRITGRFGNGYHRLESAFVPVSLFDRIHVSQSAADSVRHFWPTNEPVANRRQLSLGAVKNPLLWKTIALVRDTLRGKADIELPRVAVTVDKRIPSPSGLGGASSDAAALIQALSLVAKAASPAQSAQINEALQSDLFLKETTRLGADVPYFWRYGLVARAAMLTGIGHELAALEINNIGGFLCVPPFGFSTERMFAHVRSLPLPTAEATGGESAASKLALRLSEIPYSDEVVFGVKIVQNDFDRVAAAVFPKESALLAEAKETITRTVNQFLGSGFVVGMSGSGAALFAATEAPVSQQALSAYSGVLRARLGHGWRVYSFIHDSGPSPAVVNEIGP
jgi:4-diphosphocytidyl-2-C-methyl-D-erythritol kinase